MTARHGPILRCPMPMRYSSSRTGMAPVRLGPICAVVLRVERLVPWLPTAGTERVEIGLPRERRSRVVREPHGAGLTTAQEDTHRQTM